MNESGLQQFAPKLWHCAFKVLSTAEQTRPEWWVAKIRLFFPATQSITSFMHAHTAQNLWNARKSSLLCLSSFVFVIGFLVRPGRVYLLIHSSALSVSVCVRVFLALSKRRAEMLLVFLSESFRLVDFSFPLPPHLSIEERRDFIGFLGILLLTQYHNFHAQSIQMACAYT